MQEWEIEAMEGGGVVVRWSDSHFGKNSPGGGLQVESLGPGRALRRQWQWCKGETQGPVGPL